MTSGSSQAAPKKTKVSSAEKQARAALRRQARNRAVRSQVKTRVRKVEALISSGNLEGAREAAVLAVSAIDKAAEKKVLHANNAARRKSRLMKKLNQALARAQDKPASEKAG
ncbi:MAG: 30S ribosomal protein S20 [Dehalococcoidales bacterium]|nr:30S ribosomal protein S20 [Dehalococcoidales bacterium]